jgi:hypothetical protein
MQRNQKKQTQVWREKKSKTTIFSLPVEMFFIIFNFLLENDCFNELALLYLVNRQMKKITTQFLEKIWKSDYSIHVIEVLTLHSKISYMKKYNIIEGKVPWLKRYIQCNSISYNFQHLYNFQQTMLRLPSAKQFFNNLAQELFIDILKNPQEIMKKYEHFWIDNSEFDLLIASIPNFEKYILNLCGDEWTNNEDIILFWLDRKLLKTIPNGELFRRFCYSLKAKAAKKISGYLFTFSQNSKYCIKDAINRCNDEYEYTQSPLWKESADIFNEILRSYY